MSISRARPDGSPILSLILCSRNDAYMGNSRWRLETALNYTASRVEAVGGSNAVEIIVADWGSDVPLSDVVTLGPAARRLVSFVHAPPELARSHQRDSPFPEVLALNAAARRSRGQYIGRVDQDTLVGDRFLGWVLPALRRHARCTLQTGPTCRTGLRHSVRRFQSLSASSRCSGDG